MSTDGDIYNGLKIAYKNYFKFLEYLHNKKIVYFNYISYKVLNDNDESLIMRIHVGDIVEIEVEDDGISYAIVQAIFLHTYNNNKTYLNIFPISFITSMPKIHFVHQCVDNCLIGSHDLSQPYLLNEFFYNAI